MNSIDDLFKASRLGHLVYSDDTDTVQKPHLPSQKRKLEASRDPNEIYKSVKLNGDGDARSNGQATVEDEEDEVAVGPEMPDDLEDEVNDEEGRFFGGGITNNTAEVLDFIDEKDQGDQLKPENFDSAWVRKLALNFEKRISKNAELRAKFEGDPQKFMGSEADLDADVKTLSILSEHPELYGEFVKLGCVASLVSLLSHENTDIAIDAIEIISELTDEDVEAEQSQWDSIVDAMFEADLLDLLHQNISRLDEDVESDRAGVYHVLGVLESLASKLSIADRIGKHDSIISWLMSRSLKKEKTVSQNKQYATEVLAILLQFSDASRQRFIDLDGIDSFLQALSPYRKRDPAKGTEEEEFVENMFDCMTCVADDPAGKQKFLDAEGVELCLIMLKEGKMSRPRSIRLLDHALGGSYGGGCCEKLVEAAGLKPIFTAFMRKQDNQSTECLIGMLGSMLRSLLGDSAPRIRLLGKFVEKDYEKINRLFQLRKEYSSKVGAVDEAIATDRKALTTAEQEDLTEAWLSRRLDAGLFSLQTIDTMLAWLVAEDNGAKSKINELLKDRDESLETIRKSLEEQLDGINDTSDEANVSSKDMLRTLISFLR